MQRESAAPVLRPFTLLSKKTNGGKQQTKYPGPQTNKLVIDLRIVVRRIGEVIFGEVEHLSRRRVDRGVDKTNVDASWNHQDLNIGKVAIARQIHTIRRLVSTKLKDMRITVDQSNLTLVSRCKFHESAVEPLVSSGNVDLVSAICNTKHVC